MLKSLGFSLTELMIALVIMGILMTLSMPSYQRYVLKAHRQHAITSLLKIALAEEVYRNQNSEHHYTNSLDDLKLTYLNDPNAPDRDGVFYFNYITLDNNDPTWYVLTTYAQASQKQDRECAILTLNSKGVKTPNRCWD